MHYTIITTISPIHTETRRIYNNNHNKICYKTNNNFKNNNYTIKIIKNNNKHKHKNTDQNNDNSRQ